MGARQLEQTAHGTDVGAAGSDESSQFRPSLHQRDENHAREVCRTSARRSSSPATGRKSEQHGNDCHRVRLWKRQFDAQRFSANTKNSARTLSSPLPTRETPIEATGEPHMNNGGMTSVSSQHDGGDRARPSIWQ